MIDQIILEDVERIKRNPKGEDFEGKRVLVTGGAGFIGSWLIDVLVSFARAHNIQQTYLEQTAMKKKTFHSPPLLVIATYPFMSVILAITQIYFIKSILKMTFILPTRL